MIFEGFKVMVIGMSIVFLFLYIIIVMVSGCSKIILKFSKIENQKKQEQHDMADKNPDKKGIIMAVISSAIAKHISKGREN